MPTYNADNVIVSEAALLYAPTGTSLPDETSVAWNDSGGLFTNWTGWTPLGYTTEPASMSYSYDVFEVDVQQSTLPIKRRKQNETLTISTSLAQFEGSILALVTGGTNTNTGAGAGQKAYSKVTGGGSTALPEYMFALEGYRLDANGDEQPVRFFLYRATITVNGDISFDKAGVTAIPIQIQALADSTKPVGSQLYEAHIVTAPASS